MPELPEVETMVRGVRAAFHTGRIVGFKRCRCSCKPIFLSPSLPTLKKRVVGKTVTAIRRRGKRIVIELSSGDAFVVEPRMTGLMLLSDPPDREHLRFVWTVEQGGQTSRIWFWDRRGLGTVRLLGATELAEEHGPKNLGPDALEMTTGDWHRRLKATRREIKVALLDQKLVAGIGNLYASEILHAAGIHPLTHAHRLTSREIQRLAEAVHTVLEDAISHEGSTLSDGTYRNALNKSGGYQHKHRVYARAGSLCGTCCAETIQRTVQAQRSTFFCKQCQPERKRKKRQGRAGGRRMKDRLGGKPIGHTAKS